MQEADVEDMQAVQAGQLERFTLIVRRYQSRLFKYAVSRLRSRVVAEEAVQETFLSAYRGRSTFDLTRSFSAWLWRIHVHECGRVAGIENHRLSIGHGWVGRRREIASWSDDPVDQCVQREARERLDQFLTAIPADQAEALRLRYFGELSFKEVGDTLGITEATVKSRVRYGLAKLAEKIPSKKGSET